ncbi:MAG TPA: helix-turn-helix domain-containing protein [Candidatus Dormibacteraeota bacterium]|nr:helix-turn-helix domain-containing protein [Candidatus Dormibacteraeota bacterium]
MGVRMGTTESLGSNLARLFPSASVDAIRGLEREARERAFRRRNTLHSRGIQLPPFVLLDGHLMYRRVVETGQVRAALIADPGYFGGLRSISDPDQDALYELVALDDGRWATWDPNLFRELALADAGLAVDLLDRWADFALVLNVRLDERAFGDARQRMAAILTRYGEVIFDTSHPVAQRADLAAMIGTSRVMMYRTLRGLEADGLVKRHRGGGISIVDPERLAQLVKVAVPEESPAA